MGLSVDALGSLVEVRVRVRVTCAAHSTQLDCFCLPLAPRLQVVGRGLDPSSDASLHLLPRLRGPLAAPPTPTPTLLSEGISEVRACRCEDAYFGLAAAQMHRDKPNHQPLLPTSPIAAIPNTNPQQPGRESRDVSPPPHCTSREGLSDLPKVAREMWAATAGV